MFGAILKATNSSFQKGMTFCRSIYVKKVMKLLAFIFEQPSYYSTKYIKLMIFIFSHNQVECVSKCADKMELTSGVNRISDPLCYYSCHIFCRNIAERTGKIKILFRKTLCV